MGATFNFPALGIVNAIVEGNFVVVDDPRTGKPIKIKIEDFLNSAVARGLVGAPSVETPDEVVEFDQLTPTTGGVVFTPNTPTTEGILYVSSVDASTWIYESGAYVTKVITTSPSTPFYLSGTTIDAGGNKTAAIHHVGPLRATSFQGNGVSIVGLNATNLATGTVPTARMGSGTANNTTYLRGDNTWQAISTGGVFGISNSTGVYTYYATLTLAMASAVSGDTIEFFANYTETGNVSISLKDNVNINGNGHTYNITNNTASLIAFNNTLGSRTISNLTLNAYGVASDCIGFRTSTGNTTCFNFVVKMGAGTGSSTYAGGIIDGITCKVTGSAVGISLNGGYVLNSRSYSVSGRAITCGLSNGILYNCHGESTSDVGIYGGYMRKCVGIGSVAGIRLQGGGGATDCTGISSAGYGILITGSSGLHSNLVAISTGSWALRVFAFGIVINGFSAYSTASYAFVGFSDTIASNGYAESTVAIPFTSDGGTFTNVYSKCSWNNAGGHAFLTAGTTAELINCTLQVANASANCIYSATAKTVKYIRSTFKGATTPVNANITQGQTNTEDNQGNILI